MRMMRHWSRVIEFTSSTGESAAFIITGKKMMSEKNMADTCGNISNFESFIIVMNMYSSMMKLSVLVTKMMKMVAELKELSSSALWQRMLNASSTVLSWVLMRCAGLPKDGGSIKLISSSYLLPPPFPPRAPVKEVNLTCWSLGTGG